MSRIEPKSHPLDRRSHLWPLHDDVIFCTPAKRARKEIIDIDISNKDAAKSKFLLGQKSCWFTDTFCIANNPLASEYQVLGKAPSFK